MWLASVFQAFCAPTPSTSSVTRAASNASPGRRWSVHVAPVASRAVSFGAFAVAAALALHVTGGLLSATVPARDDMGEFERRLIPVRDALGPGFPVRDALWTRFRVALLVPGDPDDHETRRYITQYALAPVTVIEVPAAECLTKGESCAPDATHLLIPNASLAEASTLAASVGFAPLVGSPRNALFIRKRQ